MQSIRPRQLTSNLSFNGTKFTTTKPWDLATGSTVNEAAIATEAFVTSAVSGTSHSHVDAVVFVDSNRASETYTETGSEVAPYRTLSSAIAVKLADGQTDRVVFKLAPGQYLGVISRDKAAQEQAFEIHGSGAENTFIMGSASWDATIGDVLYFRDFVRVNIQDCTICNGKYGVYTRDCLSVTVRNCRLFHLGSSGTNHEFSRTEAQMATDWASRGTQNSNRSNGGAIRIRAAPHVWVDSCDIYATLRGVRIQDCGLNGGSCRITNCRADSCLESAYYTAAGDYTGATGTENMFIGNCRADNIYHHGYLCIGGANITISGCQAVNCASSAVVGWHCQDLRIIGCVFDECTSKTYIGIGVPGDNFGCVYYSCKESITSTGGYMLVALNNSMTRCGQGRAATVTGFYFGAFDTTVSSYRAIIDNNNTDAATSVHKEFQSIPLVSTQFPALATLVDANAADITAVSVIVGQNSTGVAANATDIGTNITNITSNDVDIASLMTSVTANDVDIAANTTAIATKQATLAWSTVGDNHATNPVTSEDIKTYVDANAGGSGASLSSNTFTGTQTIQPTSGAAVLELKAETGATSILQLAANPYGGASLWVGEDIFQMAGDRIEIQATSGVRIPRFSSAPTIGTNNSRFGCLYCDTSGGNSDCKLYFHNGTTWKEVTLS